MKITENHLATRQIFLWLVLTYMIVGAQSCKNDADSTNESSVDLASENVVEIITEAMEFQMPDTIPSGWLTWQYHNKSTQTHFILIDDYPDGITLDSIRARVLPPFGKGISLINEGKTDAGFAEFGKLPPWFSELIWPGGVGLLSPGYTAETTLKLDPGRYFVECYVKMNTGMFHINLGMIDAIVVSEEMSNLEEPDADVTINISSESGIDVVPPTKPGTYTFAVNFIDQKAHENLVGHDLNFAKLENNADLTVLESWMNWLDPSGLIEPAPEGVIFLGGVNDMPAGSRGYFTANLEPGQYAFISEVPKASEKNLLKTFEVLE